MKQIYELNYLKKIPQNSNFIRCLSDRIMENNTPNYYANLRKGSENQYTFNQISNRKSDKNYNYKENLPLMSQIKKCNERKIRKIKDLSQTPEQRIEERNRDVFNQFIFNFNNNTPLNIYNDHHKISNNKSVKYLKGKQRSVSQCRIEICDEEIFQQKYCNNQKKTSNTKNITTARISTSSSKYVPSNSNINENNKSDNFYSRVYRDLSCDDMKKKKNLYNFADSIIQGINGQREKKYYEKSDSNLDQLSYIQKKNDILESSNTRISNSYKNQKDDSSPVADKSPVLRTSRNKGSIINISHLSSNDIQIKNISSRTEKNNTQFISENFNLSSREEIHFMFVEAFQKKKQFLFNGSISKENSFEMDKE